MYKLCGVSLGGDKRKMSLSSYVFFQNLDNAWQWVKGLSTGGSTNTLAALKLALADPQCHAVYLLTDGRPDQVLVQVLLLYFLLIVANFIAVFIIGIVTIVL